MSISIDDKQIRKAFATAPAHLARELSREVNTYVTTGSSDFSKRAMRAPDDRRQVPNGLWLRPRMSPGLRRVTGQVSAAWYRKQTPIVSEIGAIVASVGFLDGKAARIARVHELGTVKYGGKLPDIVPKRAKYLAIPNRGRAAARATKVQSIVRLKKVGIPPRFGFVSWWTSAARVEELKRRAVAAAVRAMKKAAARG
jgi:hypothetical protein